MKEIKEFLYGKASKEKMELFSKNIEEINIKFDLKDNDKIENHITINWNAGKNKNLIQIKELNKVIESEVLSVFNEIFK
jgi:hypothetical protein